MTANFWDSQPDPVRAVLDLAAMRDGVPDDRHGFSVDPAHDRVLELFAGEHAATIRGLARSLYWIDRFGWDDALTALRAYVGVQVRPIYADQVADEHRARLEADAILNAQLVASVLHETRPAYASAGAS